jgi:hypothetical protein
VKRMPVRSTTNKETKEKKLNVIPAEAGIQAKIKSCYHSLGKRESKKR